MKIPIYSNEQIDYALSEGDHTFSDFQAFLNELIWSHDLEDKGSGIAKQAVSKGTVSLTEPQVYALQKAIEFFKLEHCEVTGAVMAVDKNAEGPFICDAHLDRIRNRE